MRAGRANVVRNGNVQAAICGKCVKRRGLIFVRPWLVLFNVFWLTVGVTEARTLSFSGYTWNVRTDGRGGPGPNHWSERNAWVDAQGCMHLQVDSVHGVWRCAEVVTAQRLGYGTYEFKVIGRLNQLDPSVVFGMFNYTQPDVGPDGTNEIDIEFTRWGRKSNAVGHWSVYPASQGPPMAQHFSVALDGTHSTHRFTWTPGRVEFQMLHGHQRGSSNEARRWVFQPTAPGRVPRSALPVHLNLWLFQGRAPRDAQPVEIIISEFRYTPMTAAGFLTRRPVATSGQPPGDRGEHWSLDIP